jgi:hypothetical protein
MTKPFRVPRINRIERIGQWAQARHRRAMDTGDLPSAFRAAELWTRCENDWVLHPEQSVVLGRL